MGRGSGGSADRAPSWWLDRGTSRASIGTSGRGHRGSRPRGLQVALGTLSIPSLPEHREGKMTGITDIREMKARIVVFGVGGAGGNAVNNMIEAGLQGVDFIVANTDAQALASSKAKRIIQMGTQVTGGLGAGSQPEVGRAAAEEAIDAIRDHLTGAHRVLVPGGIGGGA